MTSMESALIVVRLGQYLGSAVLFGGALLIVRQPAFALEKRERALLVGSWILLALSTLAALVVQAANMAGEASPFAQPSMVGMVLASTGFGYAVVVRAIATILALTLLFRPATRRSLVFVTALGAVVTVSLAWGGHGVADDGARGLVHLGGDIVHLLAANAWVGALAVLLTMTLGGYLPSEAVKVERLHVALAGFAGAGTLAVALLVATGLVNALFLIGPEHLGALTTTLYGELLLAKLVVFATMLGLAALNRWRLTPSLGATATAHGSVAFAKAQVRTSLLLETALAVAVMALVSWLGTLAPPNAG